MMDDLIERLRQHEISPYHGGCADCYGTTMDDAAERVESLTSENEAMRNRLFSFTSSLRALVVLMESDIAWKDIFPGEMRKEILREARELVPDLAPPIKELSELLK